MTQIGPGVTGIELVKVSEIWLIGMQHDMMTLVPAKFCLYHLYCMWNFIPPLPI